MTPSELSAIAARCEAATEGPWLWERCYEFSAPNGGTTKHWALRHPDAVGTVIDGFLVTHTDAETDFHNRPLGKSPNFDFIAHSRADVPALLAEVRRLTEENRILRANLSKSVYKRLVVQNVLEGE